MWENVDKPFWNSSFDRERKRYAQKSLKSYFAWKGDFTLFNKDDHKHRKTKDAENVHIETH